MSQFRYKLVLLVDDSYIDNLISKKILQNNNFAEKIVVLDSSVDAIDYLKQALSSKDNIPEIIFLDIRMPGMDGFDFLKELDSINGISNQKFKIYMLSSSLDPIDLKKIKDNKLISKFIGKPLSTQALKDI